MVVSARQTPNPSLQLTFVSVQEGYMKFRGVINRLLAQPPCVDGGDRARGRLDHGYFLKRLEYTKHRTLQNS